MGRRRRGEYADGIFHVNTRGNNGRGVYVDELDRHVFLQMLERSQQKYDWVVYAWCLMTTHYHLVVRVPQRGLSQGMCELNGSFARWSNLRHGRRDHVFGQRFASSEITTDAYLLEACRYVVLNPCRANLCLHPQQWRWGSFRASAGVEPPPQYLAPAPCWVCSPTCSGHRRSRQLRRIAVSSKAASTVPAPQARCQAPRLKRDESRAGFDVDLVVR